MVELVQDVVIISQYTSLGTNNRFIEIANLVGGTKQANVELIVSAFSHRTKSYRRQATTPSSNFKVTYIDEPKYSKNVSIQRILSHRALASNLQKYLDSRAEPDVIYCAVPSLDVADAVREYCSAHKIRFIIDVQDLWPEAFEIVIKNQLIARAIFAPMRRKADRIYREASEVVSVSQTYAKRVASIRQGQLADIRTVFLGTDLAEFDKQASSALKPDEKTFSLAYIGTLGHSYDIPTLLNALAILVRRGLEEVRLVIMGDGPLEGRFRNQAGRLGLNSVVEFTGRLSYSDMVRRLVTCQIAINPIISGSAGSIINKVGDYAAAGLPVVNSQESLEYRKLLKEYDCGVSVEPGDSEGMANAIEGLLNDSERLRQMASGSRLMAEERFDRSKTYRNLVELLLNLR